MTRWARRAEREEGKGGSRGSRESNGSRGSRGRAMTRRGRAMTNLEERSVRSRSHGTTGRNLPETPESWESRKLLERMSLRMSQPINLLSKGQPASLR